MFVRHIVVALIASLCFAGTAMATDGGDASAKGASSLEGFQISAHLGGALSSASAVNAYGFGFGLRAGTMLGKLYVGGLFSWWLGESQGDSDVASFSINTYFVGGEVGFDLGLGPIVLRPGIGIGAQFGRAKTCTLGKCNSDSEGKFAIAPSVAALLPLGALFVGAEVRWQIVFDDTFPNGTHIGAIIGLGF